MVLTKNPLAKTDRNQEIIRRIIEGRGDVSFQSLATEYGVTRSRIQRLAGDKGLSIRSMKKAHQRKVMVTCRQCGERYPKGGYTKHCEEAQHRRLTPPGEKTERNQAIVDHYVTGGYNTTEIAEYFEIPQPVVTRLLHRAGVRAVGRRPRKGGLVRDAVAVAV
jgi:transposase-like protein